MVDNIDRLIEGTAVEVEGVPPSQVIAAVKGGLAEAQRSAPDLGLQFGSVKLDLTTVRTREGQADFKVTVPVVEWELGFGGKVGKESTTVISVTFAPAPPIGVGADEVQTAFAKAILTAAEIVNNVKANHGDLTLQEASVALEFVYTRGGNASVLPFSGAITNVTTHTLTLSLKSA